MKIKSLFLLLISVFVSNAFSKDYINEQHGISFNLPDDWKVVDYEDLSPEKQQRLKKNYKQSQTLAICGIKRPDRWNRTTVIIQYQDFKDIGVHDAIRELKSENGKKMMISLAKLLALDIVGGRLKSYHIVKSYSDFDNDKNIAVGKVYYQDRDKSDFVAMVSKLLVKDGMVTLQSFSFGTEVNTFEKTIAEIIDSFVFDRSDGDGFGEDGIVSKLAQEAVSDTWKSWVIWIIGAMIVGGLIRRWIAS